MEEIVKILITYPTIQYVPAILGTMFIIILVLYKVLKFLFINLKELYLKIKSTVVRFFDKYNPHLLYKAPFFCIVKGFRTTRIINKTIDPVPDYSTYQICNALTKELLPESLSITNVLYTNGRCCRSIILPISYKVFCENKDTLYTKKVKLLALPENFKYEVFKGRHIGYYILKMRKAIGCKNKFPEIYLENKFKIFEELEKNISLDYDLDLIDYSSFKNPPSAKELRKLELECLSFTNCLIFLFEKYTEDYNYHVLSYEVDGQYNTKEVTEDLLNIIKVVK